MNKLTFTIETDAPYSDDEMVQLKSDFQDFMKVDDDADMGTATVEIADADDAPIVKLTDEQKQEVIEEFLKTSVIKARVVVENDEGTEVHTVNL